MHIFRHAKRRVTLGELARECEHAAAEGDGLDMLLAAARLECGAADVWAAEDGGDGWGEREQALTALSRAAAAHLLGLGGRPGPRLAAARTALPAAAVATGRAEPEGLRYYAAAPEGYVAAARAWREAHAREPAWVIGLRTMGSVMAPVAAAAAGAKRLATLRPVGEPQQRRIVAQAELEAAMRAWRGAVLVVDEGPGLSGSSFGGAVRWLRRLGIAPERITLLASWNPGAPEAGGLSNGYAARHWRRWQVRTAAALAPPDGAAEDLSGGRWRAALGAHRGEPVWGQHERRKYLIEGGRTIAKFAGLGEYGRATLERARRLATAGWGPAVAAGAEAAIAQGWLLYRRQTVSALRRPQRGWCEFAGRYLAWTEMEFALEREAPPTPEMEEMARINVQRLLQADLEGMPPPGPRVRLDGRMAAVEWGAREDGGWVKFDGTDHGDDPFFPGPGDIAWDLAGIGIEFGAAAGAAAAATGAAAVTP